MQSGGWPRPLAPSDQASAERVLYYLRCEAAVLASGSIPRRSYEACIAQLEQLLNRQDRVDARRSSSAG